jgi:hypothetical protein
MTRLASARLAASLALLALVACSGGGGGGGGGGTLYFSQDGNGNGLYVLDTSTGAATLVGLGLTGTTSSTIGLTESGDDDVLIGSTYSEIARIAADGGNASVIVGSEEAEGLAFHRPDGLLYGIINGDFFAADVSTGLRLGTLDDPGVDIEGLASDAANDQIFGIGDTTDLWVYDVALGNWSIVGSIGIDWEKGAGLAYDPHGRVLYAIGASGGGENLYRIDPVTAVPTLVGPTGLIGTEGGLGFVR